MPIQVHFRPWQWLRGWWVAPRGATVVVCGGGLGDPTATIWNRSDPGGDPEPPRRAGGSSPRAFGPRREAHQYQGLDPRNGVPSHREGAVKVPSAPFLLDAGSDGPSDPCRATIVMGVLRVDRRFGGGRRSARCSTRASPAARCCAARSATLSPGGGPWSDDRDTRPQSSRLRSSRPSSSACCCFESSTPLRSAPWIADFLRLEASSKNA